MPIALTIVLVLAAIVLLAFGVGSTGGALRFLTGGAALLVAIAATAATVVLFWLGQKSHWTSDGPGMLFVMIAVLVCAVVAVVGWVSVLGIASTALAPVDALPSAPPGSKRVLRLLGLALLVITVIGQAITVFLGRGRAAHSSPVVAVSFATGSSSRFVSIDAAGTFVDWDLHSRREVERRTIPEVAGASELFFDSTAEHGFAIANGRAVRFDPLRRKPVEAIPDARHIARGAAVVVARDQALLFFSYSDWTKPPYQELAWPEPILAIAARDEFVAVADRVSISLLDARPGFMVQTKGRAPAPGAIRGLEVLNDRLVLALDGSGGGWRIDVYSGATEPLAASLAAAAQHVFLVSGREVLEYDPWKKTVTPVARIGSGARSIDTRGEQVAFGFEGGEVVLGTRTGGRLETTRLTDKPAER